MKLARNRFFFVALLAAVFLAAWSCAQAPGQIDLTIASSGAAGGKSGILHMEVREDTMSGTVVSLHDQNPYTLVSGTPYTWTFSDLGPGTYVVIAYLDVTPYSATPGTGDAVPSSGNATVTVSPGGATPVTMTLDTITL